MRTLFIILLAVSVSVALAVPYGIVKRVVYSCEHCRAGCEDSFTLHPIGLCLSPWHRWGSASVMGHVNESGFFTIDAYSGLNCTGDVDIGRFRRPYEVGACTSFDGHDFSYSYSSYDDDACSSEPGAGLEWAAVERGFYGSPSCENGTAHQPSIVPPSQCHSAAVCEAVFGLNLPCKVACANWTHARVTRHAEDDSSCVSPASGDMHVALADICVMTSDDEHEQSFQLSCFDEIYCDSGGLDDDEDNDGSAMGDDGDFFSGTRNIALVAAAAVLFVGGMGFCCHAVRRRSRAADKRSVATAAAAAGCNGEATEDHTVTALADTAHPPSHSDQRVELA